MEAAHLRTTAEGPRPVAARLARGKRRAQPDPRDHDPAPARGVRAAQPRAAPVRDATHRGRGDGPWAAGAAAGGSHGLGHPGERPAEGLHRAARQARADGSALQRRRAPDEHHRPHRLGGRPPRRRVVADGRCPPQGRLARQRHHPAARARRADDVDPPFRGRAVQGRGPDPAGNHQRADGAWS